MPRKPTKFLKDKERGDRAEQLVLKLLWRASFKAGLATLVNPEWLETTLSSHDIWAECQGIPMRIEVKLDDRAAQTGNIAIEYWNTRSDTPSGISVTRSQIWIQVIGHKKPQVWAASTLALRRFVASTPAPIHKSRFGDGNSSCHLYPFSWLKSPDGPLVRVDVLSPNSLSGLLCEMAFDYQVPGVVNK